MIKSPEVKIGNICIGGNNPIAIQSMTNTNTADTEASVSQCIELFDAGAEIVRLTVNDHEAAVAIPKIKSSLKKKGYSGPLVGDFHFNSFELLNAYPDMASSLDKYRINPSNIDDFNGVIHITKANNKPIRIGINAGSIQTKSKNILDDMVSIALKYAQDAEELGLPRDQIVISVKISDVMECVKVHEMLHKKMQELKRVYALHIGLTEAGSGLKGAIYSTSALSILLNKGIGDTIRVSITSEPHESRTKEIKIAKNILQALSLRFYHPQIISCPGCGRTDNEYFQDLSQKIKKYVEDNAEKWLQINPQTATLKIAVMGCRVNGPGESQSADIGINLPGKTEEKMATVYTKGKYLKTLKGKNIYNEFIEILENFI
ncbi:flavodoxin-dependent (E)-4-hydroxy-3-methylbut-2-enyl-diphosphate synthase [Candidatus Peregrinibacteria bacterium]|nr:flavodoxin-dependent (E)-4-hydroxy-3-methylbut-2-enyl-diphosphate synthase [Candidatus Peregrinibacteria bacterium]